jgi:HK97 gp10 family phage protein
MGLLVNHFPRIIAEIPVKSEAAVEASCILIEHGAARRARVESGAMKEGFRHELFPDFAGRVWNIKEYAIYNEFGTKYMSAQPMVRPAVVETEAKFIEFLVEAFSV